jgi:hypothetical protein
MFIKYTITILNSKWIPIKSNLKVDTIPRSGEYIYLGEQYYEVLNVVHSIDKNHQIFVIVSELENQKNKL